MITTNEQRYIELMKQGYYIQEDRRTKRVRLIKHDSTEVHTVDKRSYVKFIRTKIVCCSLLNRLIVNYSLNKESIHVR